MWYKVARKVPAAAVHEAFYAEFSFLISQRLIYDAWNLQKKPPDKAGYQVPKTSKKTSPPLGVSKKPPVTLTRRFAAGKILQEQRAGFYSPQECSESRIKDVVCIFALVIVAMVRR